jgi:nitroreductase
METLVESQAKKNEKKQSLIDIIYQRRSVRKYKKREVEKSLIDQIIDAGRMAPSAMNKQLWKFYVLTNPEEIALFSKMISRVVIKGVIRSGIKKIIKTTQDFLHFSHNIDFLKTDDPIFHGAPVVIFISSPKQDE